MDIRNRVTETSIEPCRVGLPIGLPKTGTTSLQLNCFSRHPEIAYFGQTNFSKDLSTASLLKGLLGVTTGRHVEVEVNKTIQDALADKKAVMISDEALTMGQFMVRAKYWPISTKHYETAVRAKKLLGDAHVFIVLRNQFDWLVSWHRQGLANGKYHVVEFERWLNEELGERREYLFSLLNYKKLCEEYQRAFGEDRVHVDLYERYSISSFGDLAQEICKVLGVDGDFAKVSMGHSAKNVTSTSFIKKDVTGNSKEVLFKQTNNSSRESILDKFQCSNRALFLILDKSKPKEWLDEKVSSNYF